MSWVYCGVSRLLQVPSISITTDILFVVSINHVAREIEWIAKASKDPSSVDPPRPAEQEVMADISLRSDTDRGTPSFASRMICAYLRE